jgi:hypothetical protein
MLRHGEASKAGCAPPQPIRKGGAAMSIVLALSPLFYLLAHQNDLKGK